MRGKSQLEAEEGVRHDSSTVESSLSKQIIQMRVDEVGGEERVGDVRLLISKCNVWGFGSLVVLITSFVFENVDKYDFWLRCG